MPFRIFTFCVGNWFHPPVAATTAVIGGSLNAYHAQKNGGNATAAGLIGAMLSPPLFGLLPFFVIVGIPLILVTKDRR